MHQQLNNLLREHLVVEEEAELGRRDTVSGCSERETKLCPFVPLFVRRLLSRREHENACCCRQQLKPSKLHLPQPRNLRIDLLRACE